MSIPPGAGDAYTEALLAGPVVDTAGRAVLQVVSLTPTADSCYQAVCVAADRRWTAGVVVTPWTATTLLVAPAAAAAADAGHPDVLVVAPDHDHPSEYLGVRLLRVVPSRDLVIPGLARGAGDLTLLGEPTLHTERLPGGRIRITVAGCDTFLYQTHNKNRK